MPGTRAYGMLEFVLSKLGSWWELLVEFQDVSLLGREWKFHLNPAGSDPFMRPVLNCSILCGRMDIKAGQIKSKGAALTGRTKALSSTLGSRWRVSVHLTRLSAFKWAQLRFYFIFPFANDSIPIF